MTTRPNPAALLGRADWLARRLAALPNGSLWGPDGDANYIARVTAIDALANDLAHLSIYPAQVTVMDGRTVLRMGGICSHGSDLVDAAHVWITRIRHERKEGAA